MGLNNISLSSFLLTQMYPDSLVEDPGKAADTKKEAPLNVETAWKFLGNNQKQVLIAVDYEGISHLPDPQLEFLLQLLSACRLSLNDVALINSRNYSNIDYSDILTHFNARAILLFGITSLQFGFPFETPPYQVQAFANYTVIHAAPLHHLQNDKPAKGLLWAGLKKIFNL